MNNNKAVIRNFLVVNWRLIKKFQLSDIFFISQHSPYWTIRTMKLKLTGYGIKRLSKYKNGLSKRLEQLAYNYGNEREFTIKPNDIIVDIGANIGEFSLFGLIKGASVLSIEPDENIYVCTVKNVKSFSKSLGVEKLAIASKNGDIDFFQAPGKADSSTIPPKEYDSKVRVITLTLDSLFEKYDFEAVDLIKCDAEGAEPEVLHQSSRALEKTKVVTFNCGPERFGQDTVNEVCAVLKSKNFEVKVIDGYRPKSIVVGKNKRFFKI